MHLNDIRKRLKVKLFECKARGCALFSVALALSRCRKNGNPDFQVVRPKKFTYDWTKFTRALNLD